jgi:hypothetical protein
LINIVFQTFEHILCLHTTILIVYPPFNNVFDKLGYAWISMIWNCKVILHLNVYIVLERSCLGHFFSQSIFTLHGLILILDFRFLWLVAETRILMRRWRHTFERRETQDEELKNEPKRDQGCQIFSFKTYQNWENIPNCHNICHIAKKYLKSPQIFQIAIHFTRNLHSRNLPNKLKLGILVRR